MRWPVIIFSFLFLLMGCGVKEQAPTVTPAAGIAIKGQQATVQGFVFSNSLVADPADAPEGSTPTPGARLRLRIVESDGALETREAFANSNGFFEFKGVALGLLEVDLFVDPKADAAVAQPDAKARITAVVAESVLQVNRVSLIDRNKAFELIKAEVPDTALVYETQNPLPAGASVFTEAQFFRGVVSEDGTQSDPFNVTKEPLRTLVTDEWFFLVDLDPFALQMHDLRYVFVNAKTGAIETIEGKLAPPVINRTPLWQDRGRAGIPDAPNAKGEKSKIPFPWPEDVVQSPLITPELQQMIDEVSDSSAAATATFSVSSTGTATSVEGAGSPEDIFAILIDTLSDETRTDSFKATNRWISVLRSGGVPESQISLIITRDAEAPLDPNGNVKISEAPHAATIQRINKVIEDRLKEGKRSTLIIYFSGHGAREVSGRLEQILSGFFLVGEYGGLQFNYRNAKSATDQEFWTDGLRNSKACRVIIVLESCYSENHAKFLATRAGGLSNAPFELRVFASAGKESSAKALFGTGPLYTRKFLKNARVVGNDLVVDIATVEGGALGFFQNPTHFFKPAVDANRDGIPDSCAFPAVTIPAPAPTEPTDVISQPSPTPTPVPSLTLTEIPSTAVSCRVIAASDTSFPSTIQPLLNLRLSLAAGKLFFDASPGQTKTLSQNTFVRIPSVDQNSVLRFHVLLINLQGPETRTDLEGRTTATPGTANVTVSLSALDPGGKNIAFAQRTIPTTFFDSQGNRLNKPILTSGSRSFIPESTMSGNITVQNDGSTIDFSVNLPVNTTMMTITFTEDSAFTAKEFSAGRCDLQ